jgi:putative membrane protein
MDEATIRIIHFTGIFFLTSMLVWENVLIAKNVSAVILRKLALIDGLYGLAAGVVAISGAYLWLAAAKPSEFYTSNPIFHLKLSLFVVIALISIFPTIFFLKHRKINQDKLALPKHVMIIKRIELALLIFIPICAVLMARGIGLA